MTIVLSPDARDHVSMPRREPSPDLYRSYLFSVLRNLQYRATWLPNATIELGSVGLLANGVFQERQHLRDFGVEFTTTERPARANKFVYQSSSGVRVTFKARGEAADGFQAIGRAKAGALVEFSRQGAALISAPSCVISRIADIRSLERQLVRLDDWSRRYVIVTEVVSAETATILIANSKSSRVELAAQARTTDSPAGIAELSTGFRAVSSNDVGIEIVAEGGLTPFYKVEQFRRAGIRRQLGLHAPGRKAAARKTTARKTTARKTTARKTTARKTTARKTTARKTTARKTTARKTTARKTTARKTTARKTTARKTTARKTTAR